MAEKPGHWRRASRYLSAPLPAIAHLPALNFSHTRVMAAV
jgi:hypothetical protein